MALLRVLLLNVGNFGLVLLDLEYFAFESSEQHSYFLMLVTALKLWMHLVIALISTLLENLDVTFFIIGYVTRQVAIILVTGVSVSRCLN